MRAAPRVQAEAFLKARSRREKVLERVVIDAARLIRLFTQRLEVLVVAHQVEHGPREGLCRRVATTGQESASCILRRSERAYRPAMMRLRIALLQAQGVRDCDMTGEEQCDDPPQHGTSERSAILVAQRHVQTQQLYWRKGQ